MRRKKAEGTSVSDPKGRVTPVDVQQVEFRLAFRGYNERDVDAFLDRVTEDLAAYMEDNQRLRAGQPALGAEPAMEVGTARSEAERIVAEAREEAERIVRDAKARAALAGAPAGDSRAAVAPFLNTEREFLQSLGSLVQSHAEEVKQMVFALRARAEAGAAPSPVAPATTDDAFAPISVPAAEEGTGGATDEDDKVVPEPAPAQLRRDSGEHSLRELFWGED